MTALLVIAGAWLGLLLLVLGMVHAATSTPTPRPVSRTPLTLDDDTQMRAVQPKPFNESPRPAALAPREAA
jgi:hypothetical protein